MQSNINHDVLLNAIDDYPPLTSSQRNILKVLVTLDSEVNVKAIMDILKLKRQSIQPNIKKLEEAGFIVSAKKGVHFFSVNKGKMLEIIDFYNKKQKIIQKF